MSAAAREQRRLNEQDIAADGGPGQTGGHPWPVSALGGLGEVAGSAEILGHPLGRDDDGSRGALGEGAGGFSATARNLALKVPDACFARVVADDGQDRRGLEA